MDCLDQREGKRGRKGTDSFSLHSMKSCSRPHINSAIHTSPLIRDTGTLRESLTMEPTLSGPKIPFLCLIDGLESLSLCSEATDLGVINSDNQYPGWWCYLISTDLSFRDLCTGVWIESPGEARVAWEASPKSIESHRWLTTEWLSAPMKAIPDVYTQWLVICLWYFLRSCKLFQSFSLKKLLFHSHLLFHYDFSLKTVNWTWKTVLIATGWFLLGLYTSFCPFLGKGTCEYSLNLFFSLSETQHDHLYVLTRTLLPG